MSAGVAFIEPLRATLAVETSAQRQYGVSLGYKLRSNTLLGSFNRSASDIYGLGATATETASGGWAWKRPRSSLSANATFGYSHLIGPAFPNSGTSAAGHRSGELSLTILP